MNQENFIGIIPARYGSSRFEGKPLADIFGKTMIQRVYERVSEVLTKVVVATDDIRIANEVRRFGGYVVMTSKNHENGTSRCLEAAQLAEESFHWEYQTIINIQGDEPLIEPGQIQDLMDSFDEGNPDFSTLVIPVQNQIDLENDSEVFVTIDKNNYALYFSRAVIPVVKGKPKAEWLQHQTYYKHVGLYAYTRSALKAFSALPPSPLEQVESLEQLRWLENGKKIKVGKTNYETIPVDTPEDLERVKEIIQQSEAL